MQHLDEGTVHSWLDGALSADEATRVQAHVAECRQCAAAVAEARGFIAASSRILTALDNAPRGVIPVAAPVKRVNPMVWRIAATVLVVAAGSLVVVQNRGSDEPLRAVSENQAITSAQPPAVSEAGSSADGATAPAADPAASNMAADEVPASTSVTSKAPAAAFSRKGAGAAGNARRGTTMGDNTALAERSEARTRQPGVASDLAAAAPVPAAPTTVPARVVELRARDAATEPERLKVVGSPRQLGAKVTLYEVAPGDTVTLTEAMPMRLESVVVTGAAAGTQMMAPQATAKSVGSPSTRRADAAVATAPESQRAAQGAASAPAVPAPAPMLRPGATITPRSITWSDPVTGNRLTLTGRMPESRLQELRVRIERERAAAEAAAKKNP